MEKYNKSKYYLKDSKMVRDEEVWWDEKYKIERNFQMTKGYSKYLHDKRIEEHEHNLKVMRHKLEYQMKIYGEVDQIDYQEFIYELNRVVD